MALDEQGGVEQTMRRAKLESLSQVEVGRASAGGRC